jgi:hypothetical protein
MTQFYQGRGLSFTIIILNLYSVFALNSQYLCRQLIQGRAMNCEVLFAGPPPFGGCERKD